MWWVVLPVVVCAVGLGAMVARARRNQHVLAQMRALLAAGRHQEVLDHALPSKPLLELARSTQATSAVLTGRFTLALDLLAESVDDGTSPPSTGTSPGTSLRAASLNGLGRYGEVARLLGDVPPMGALRRLRAQAAVEVGDDALAEALLADAYLDPLEEAGRLRLLGDLHVRRGRLREGERLARTARATYAGSGTGADQVDAAVCTLLVGQARLAAGAPAEAWTLVRASLDGLAIRPDNAPALTLAHALAARVRAALGDGPDAGRHLTMAQEQALRCQSPALEAAVTCAAALVALDLGDDEVAGRLLREAIAAHEQLGATPVLVDLRARLTALGR